MSIYTHWDLVETPPYEPLEGWPICLQEILAQRGVTGLDPIQSFLSPRLKTLADPFRLPDMEIAVERIFQAIDNQEEVVIYGDYDVDGTCSVTILCKVLEAYGLSARPFVPFRSTEGYGLNQAALERCMREGSCPPSLIIAVDCGTISVEPIAELKKQGVEVIVIDHHEAGEVEKPQCVALVNPKFGEGFEYLCAAGVAFKVAHALLRVRSVSDFDLRWLLDLVALATICDIVPLQEENRILVRHGLRQMEKSHHPGLVELMRVSKVSLPLSSQQIGFRIGPRLNAAGRMDCAIDTVEILSTNDESRGHQLARDLDAYNSQRQELEQLALKQSLEQLEGFNVDRDGAIVVGSSQWHPGVVGIVASRLMQKFYCPAFVISFDQEGIGKGSGRSVEGVSLVEAIQNNQENLLAGGGHHMAAGISIDQACLPSFREGFQKFVKKERGKGRVERRLVIDREVDFSLLTLDFLSCYEQLQPFGPMNQQPLFMAKQVEYKGDPQCLQGKHLKFYFVQRGMKTPALEGLFFGKGEMILPETPWDIVFCIERNTFRGNNKLQLILKDIRSAS